jgi:hypothetical protein
MREVIEGDGTTSGMAAVDWLGADCDPGADRRAGASRIAATIG